MSAEKEVWPDYLMIRDTGLHDDMGGLGQRIHTTAGAGYKKVKYIRADIAERDAALRAADNRDAAGVDDSHAFKNFHRSLCARFGYTHDETDWRRDQVSLEEHIATLITPAAVPAGEATIAPAEAKGDACPRCRGTGETCTGTIDGIPELFNCHDCLGSGLFTAPVGTTIADAAGDQALTLDAARELLRDVAHAIKLGRYNTPQPADGGAVARSRSGAVAFLFDFIAEYDEHEESEWSPSWRALAERARELCEKHATEIAGKEAAYLAGLGDDPRLDGWAPDTRPPAAQVQAAPQEGEAAYWERWHPTHGVVSVNREPLGESIVDNRWEDRPLYRANPSACELGAVRDGFYLASFKHKANNGEVMWWKGDNAGYSPDLEQAGIYTELVPGYHDSEHTVPVPISFLAGLRVRRTVDPGDSLNTMFWSAKLLREALQHRGDSRGGEG